MNFTVLTVDDSVINLDIMESFLAPLHLDLVKALSAEEGLELIQRQHVSMIITDIMMGGNLRSGVELAESARDLEDYEMTPMIAITCDNSFTNTEDEIFDDVIHRPVGSEVLISTVKKFLPGF